MKGPKENPIFNLGHFPSSMNFDYIFKVASILVLNQAKVMMSIMS